MGTRKTRKDFDAQRGPDGALLGDPDEEIEKIKHHSKILGGISRIAFMMNPALVTSCKAHASCRLIGKHLAPTLRKL